MWRVLAIASVAVLLTMLDVTIVNVAFPDIRRTFPASLSDTSWIFNAYSIVFAAALVPFGRLADRIGRRRVFLAGLGTFLAASVACAAAGSVDMLIAARVGQALGAAALVPASLSLVLVEFPLSQRMTAISLWTAGGGLAAALGPPVGGLLVGSLTWRSVFLVNVILGVPLVVLALRWMRESRDAHAGPWPDVFGAVLLASGVGTLALAVVTNWAWTAASALLLVLFVIRSAGHPAPVIELDLVRIRSFWVSTVGSFVFALGFYAMPLCGVLFLTDVWHYPVLTAGAALTVGPVAAVLAAPPGGRFADRHGPRPVTVTGGLAFGLGATLLSLAGGTPDYVAEFLPGAVLAGIGIGLVFPAFGGAALTRLPPERLATGIAGTWCVRQLGAVLGVAVLAVVLRSGDYHLTWLLIAGTGALTAGAGLLLEPIRKEVST